MEATQCCLHRLRNHGTTRRPRSARSVLDAGRLTACRQRRDGLVPPGVDRDSHTQVWRSDGRRQLWQTSTHSLIRRRFAGFNLNRFAPGYSRGASIWPDVDSRCQGHTSTLNPPRLKWCHPHNPHPACGHSLPLPRAREEAWWGSIMSGWRRSSWSRTRRCHDR